MPLAVLLLLFAPVPVAMVAASADLQKEKEVNQICVDKFQTTEEIKQCKDILMRIR